MKVLEEPTYKGPRSYTFRCKNTRCGAKLQATEDEGKIHYDQRDGDSYEFHCVCCGHANYIDVHCFDGR